jgi:hypothetical protein
VEGRDNTTLLPAPFSLQNPRRTSFEIKTEIKGPKSASGLGFINNFALSLC